MFPGTLLKVTRTACIYICTHDVVMLSMPFPLVMSPDDIYLTHFMVTLEYLLGDQGGCGVGNLTHMISYVSPLSHKLCNFILPLTIMYLCTKGADNGSYSITLEADSPKGVPVMGCTYQLTVSQIFRH